MNLITIFRVVLVSLTGCFMAYHTQIFISRIEPNLWFSWLASLLIEAFLISLAIAHTWVSRGLLVPLFLISVMSASASFIVSNETLLSNYFTGKKVISQIEKDINETQKEFMLDAKYTTKTLQRERQLKDELAEKLKNQTGDLTLINSFLFLIFVFILQLVSVYTAMHLKISLKRQAEISLKREPETVKVSEIKEPETEIREVKKDVSEEKKVKALVESQSEKEAQPEERALDAERVQVGVDRQEVVKALQKMKGEGLKLDQLAAFFDVSKSTVSRVINYPATSVSDEVFTKIEAKMRDSYPTPQG